MQFNPSNFGGGPSKSNDSTGQSKQPQMPFNPQNIPGLGNSSFGLSNIVSNPLAPPFGATGMPGEHMGYPYVQDMQYQEHMKKLREKFGEMKEQIDKMEKNPELFKTHQLPLARVKKIMKSDEDVRMISAEAPVLFAKACEIFIIELTHRAWFHTEEGKRRTLQKNDIAQCIANTDIFDFLIDIIPREEYQKNTIVKKPTDPYMNFNNYPNPATMLSNMALPPNLNYNLPSSMGSMGMNLGPNLLGNNSMFAFGENFKNPLVFPSNNKSNNQSSNPMMNPNLLNYSGLMNPGQYPMNFDLGGGHNGGGQHGGGGQGQGGMPSHGQGSGNKGNMGSKKEADS
jgi:nuclear transcription factor Y gamma